MSRIYLIGPRGSGKTTVGKKLASALGYAFSDLDERLCSTQGCSVAEIVGRGGWPEFRRLESEILRETGRGEKLVFATGGGVILSPENRQFLRDFGRVIWLNAGLATLAARLGAEPNPGQRPSLTGSDPIHEIAAVLAEREPLYRDACHHSVNADGTADDVCAAILNLL